MAGKKKNRILTGATVRLKNGKRMSVVMSDCVTIDGKRVPGGVILDKPLGGLRYWNTRELVLVTPAPIS